MPNTLNPPDQVLSHHTPVSSATASAAQHVLFLDGMRGAAAFYVVLFHLATVLPRTKLAPWAQWATEPFVRGHLAVGVFIVLSGYLLMLPPAKSNAFELRGGLKTFFLRRSRRILPPYYAALLLSIPPEIVRLRLHGEPWSWGGLLSHLFLVHNLRQDWVGTINGPLWSVAVEYQIYAIFGLLLLPLCRRFKTVWAAVGVAFVLGVVPAVLLPSPHNFWWSCPWLLSLFAMGMTAAVITQRGNDLPWAKAASHFPWMLVAVPCFVLSAIHGWDYAFEFIVSYLLAGLAAMSCIICGVSAVQQNAPRGAGRTIVSLFGSPLMVRLGAFSYSLYLIHFPLLSVLDTGFKRFSANPMLLLAYQFCIVLPVVVCTAYLFYLLFEKRFTTPTRSR